MTGDQNVLWHQSGVNQKGEPFVQLIRGETVISQMDVEQAREHGLAMLEAAEAAETDAFMWRWGQRMGLGAEQAGAMLVDFRKMRAEVTGKRHGATSARDWVYPDGKKPPSDGESI